MFVSAKIHAHALENLAVERARRELLSLVVARLETESEWLHIRVNQLEKERAILFREVTHLPIPVPEIVANPVPTSADHIMAGDMWLGVDDGTVVD